MTVVNPKSISGINSITTGSGSDNLLTIHTSDASSTERVRINSSGDVIVGSGITVSPDGDIFATGVTTSTTFVGNLTGNVTGNISGGTVAGSTGTFSGAASVGGDITATSTDAGTTGPTLKLFHNSASPADNDVVSRINFSGDDDAGNETEYARIDTTAIDVSNGSETGYINFHTRALSSFNPILSLQGRSSASAPSVGSDATNGLIVDVYNGGNPYPRYVNLIAKGGGDTDSNLTFWTEAVGGAPTEKVRIEAGGDVDIKSGVIKLASGANRRLIYRSGNNDLLLEADSGDFYRQDIANSTHEFFTGNTERLSITSGGIVQIGGDLSNGTGDLDTANSKLSIKQSANNQEDGIYIERSGERRGFYAYVGGALSQSDAFGIASQQLGTKTDVLAIDRGGDIAVGAGDIFFSTAGKGIVLGATSNTSANTLSDYETGTYTITATLGSGSVSSYTSRTGSYIKIGSVVHVVGRLHLNLSTSNVTSFSINLPFANESGTERDTSCVCHIIRANGGDPVQGVRLFRIIPDASSASMQDHEGVDYGNLGATNPHININLTYHCVL